MWEIFNFLKVYIYRVLKQVHPDTGTGISSKAMSMSIMNSWVFLLFLFCSKPNFCPKQVFREFLEIFSGLSTTCSSALRRRRPAGALQQALDDLLARDPDRCPADPARRVGQARRLRRHQSGHQVHLVQVMMRWKRRWTATEQKNPNPNGPL